jgi:hypothetical protein
MAGNGRPYPKKGWKNAHDAMPTCNDKEAMKWMSAFMKNEEPNLIKMVGCGCFMEMLEKII